MKLEPVGFQCFTVFVNSKVRMTCDCSNCECWMRVPFDETEDLRDHVRTLQHQCEPILNWLRELRRLKHHLRHIRALRRARLHLVRAAPVVPGFPSMLTKWHTDWQRSSQMLARTTHQMSVVRDVMFGRPLSEMQSMTTAF